ncbi:hypothetical protein BX661DRAFT_188628 [Kickxella alabastrina]|uniref:uncharacterized protein n=1 Tax=Kickxella alabastrina TaxID=61397 RepID=UPI00221FA797|nr:uncharacterized protein BX661DRAFT_188628 [Kickxella alabastrina]KAI7821119.1 hypothetical protein BX661DRAFT_188628 [Kickxella alabastrina]
MRTASLAVFFTAAVVSAAPLAVRQTIVGQPDSGSDMVNGPTAINTPLVNNGELKDSSLDSSTSFNGAVINNKFVNHNENFNLYDNVFSNPEVNMVFSAVSAGAHPGLWFKRQASVDAGNVNAPAAVSDTTFNSGALREGTAESGVSLDGAYIPNAVATTPKFRATSLSTEFNTASNNNGPTMAGNDNVLIPINNQGMILNLDSSFFASRDAQQRALISSFTRPRFF